MGLNLIFNAGAGDPNGNILMDAESGQVPVFVRDPDRNEIELRGREQGAVEGVIRYMPSSRNKVEAATRVCRD